MPDTDRRPRRRKTLYVKQNKAYQSLLALLIVVFIIVTAVVVNSTMLPNASPVWRDNVLIRMFIERAAARGGNM
ncbi:MAG: hypothetical protein LBS75_09495 [Synergistaceae bacterium]|jgi:hypothetical protein|nr:hypothetical protein [Synergistaceae bacterium]